MKVWEKISDLAGPKFKIDTAEKVKSWMYSNRCIPCDIEEEFNIVNGKMNNLCAKHKLDCFPCMEEYLEIEVM
jgi:hypothetical protein